MQALLGIAVLVAAAWLVSEGRGQVRWRAVGLGLMLQLVLAALFLRVAWISETLLLLNHVVYAVEAATSAPVSSAILSTSSIPASP